MIGPNLSFDPSTAGIGFTNPLICVVQHDGETRERLCQLFLDALLPARAFRSGKDFLAQRHHAGPCCLITGVSLSDITGFDLQIALAGRPEQVVFVSGDADVSMCARAMKAGAVDFLTSTADGRLLLDAAGRALTRSQSILAARHARAAARARFDSLTLREIEVMHRVLAGRLNKQAASDLGIAEKTIKIHRGRVMHKLGVESVAELVRLAMLAEIE